MTKLILTLALVGLLALAAMPALAQTPPPADTESAAPACDVVITDEQRQRLDTLRKVAELGGERGSWAQAHIDRAEAAQAAGETYNPRTTVVTITPGAPGQPATRVTTILGPLVTGCATGS